MRGCIRRQSGGGFPWIKRWEWSRSDFLSVILFPYCHFPSKAARYDFRYLYSFGYVINRPNIYFFFAVLNLMMMVVVGVGCVSR